MIIEAAKRHDGFPPSLPATAQEGKCLPVFTVLKGSDCHKLGQNQGSLTSSSVYADFFHIPS
jgi:hypothetical protein